MENDAQSTINDYNQLIYDIYDREGLSCLSDNNYSYNERNVMAVSNPGIVRMVGVGLYQYLNEVRVSLNLHEFNDIPFENEIIVASADIKYRIGTMFLYLPYIVILQDSYYMWDGEKQFHYSQTRDDARFNREIPVAFEALYKYWQRLSDYLLQIFPDALVECQGRSFFHTSIDYIRRKHPELTSSDNYKWLSHFAQKRYPEFNKKRKFFVHTAGYDNQYFQDFLKAHNDENAVAMMDAERAELLPFLKEHSMLCMEGYFKVMDFVNEIGFLKNADEAEAKFSYSLLQLSIPPSNSRSIIQ